MTSVEYANMRNLRTEQTYELSSTIQHMIKWKIRDVRKPNGFSEYFSIRDVPTRKIVVLSFIIMDYYDFIYNFISVSVSATGHIREVVDGINTNEKGSFSK